MKYIPSSPANCPYPNLWSEYNLQVLGSSRTYADHAGVTVEIFENMLVGVGDLTPYEKREFSRTYYPNNIKYDYLFSPHISFYDLENKKHLHKFERLYYQFYQTIGNATEPFRKSWKDVSQHYLDLDELINQRFVTRAYYNYILHLIDWVKMFYYTSQSLRSTIYASKA